MFLNYKFGRKEAQVNIFLNSVCQGGGSWVGNNLAFCISHLK